MQVSRFRIMFVSCLKMLAIRPAAPCGFYPAIKRSTCCALSVVRCPSTNCDGAKIGKSVPRTDSVLVWCRRCAGSLLTLGALEAIDAIIRSRRGCAVACQSSAARRRPNRPNRTQQCPVFWMADARADIVRAAWLTQGRSLTPFIQKLSIWCTES